MGQFHWDPSSYRELMCTEVPAYERLQEELVRACGPPGAGRTLDLGTGTGETAARVLDAYPGASLVGIDASRDMLAVAAQVLPAARADLRVARLEDPLPDGPFDLVVSALAVHHLDGEGKRDLFKRVAAVLEPGGRMVIADVVVPEDPADAVTPVDGDYDRPSMPAEQLHWIEEAGLRARVAWELGDLAVMVGDATSAPRP